MGELIYRQAGLPVFQNKVYPSQEAAYAARIGDVELVQCPRTGLVHNRLFDPELLDYDQEYQNEQACSLVFRQHLEEVLRIVLGLVDKTAHGLEIGCGKGHFLELLSKAGADITGYDPAYQGNNPKIRKEYYRRIVGPTPDYIVLRHVLEHVPQPWDFLARLAEEVGAPCRIYIEVPCFDWIIRHKAIYDIFYEHCNYFTLDLITAAFGNVQGSGHLFGGQYLYLIADLATFRPPKAQMARKFNEIILDRSLSYIQDRIIPGRPTYIWGAGAKGVTLTNLLYRRGQSVDALIDINPVKQECYVGYSGAPILSPEIAEELIRDSNLLIMNPNYLEEITKFVARQRPNIVSVV